jgi:hypothetical protein
MFISRLGWSARRFATRGPGKLIGLRLYSHTPRFKRSIYEFIGTNPFQLGGLMVGKHPPEQLHGSLDPADHSVPGLFQGQPEIFHAQIERERRVVVAGEDRRGVVAGDEAVADRVGDGILQNVERDPVGHTDESDRLTHTGTPLVS